MASKRGRKSKAELDAENEAPDNVLELHPPLQPPEFLTTWEKSLFADIVDSKPANWFLADTEQLLLAYVKHCAAASKLNDAIDKFILNAANDDNLKKYNRLLAMRERETRQINALSRSMRLTQQSRYDERSAARLARKRVDKPHKTNPWEFK